MLDSHATGARRPGTLATILSAIAAMGRAVAHRHRVRHTIAYLHSLDDRLLKDMGVTRGELYTAAMHGRMPGEDR
ncbi:MAG TPA: DUF1127 domain-containing protein [Azospirillum sp.]|nr:DUF1127 domain-containing protein [Azospirillum sp.]